MLFDNDVGNFENNLLLYKTSYRYHTEIVKQTYKIFADYNIFGREILYEFANNLTVGYERLNYRAFKFHFLVLADKHFEFCIVGADIGIDDILRKFAVVAQFVYEIEQHIGVEHCGLAKTIFRKTIIVVPRADGFDDFVGGAWKIEILTVIFNHIPCLTLGKTGDFVEICGGGVVGADVESACEVVKRNGRHTCDVQPFKSVLAAVLDGVEECAQIASAVRFVHITAELGVIRQDIVGKIVVFVDEDIDFLSCLLNLFTEFFQFCHSIIALIQLRLRLRRKQITVFVAE